LTHLLRNNYQILLTLITEEEISPSEIESENTFLLHLKVLRRKSPSINIPSALYTQFEKTEFIGLLKEPLEFPIPNATPYCFFDFCPIDPETNLPVKDDELFEKQSMDIFLSKISDLSFEINHLFFPFQQKTGGFVYLAETTYELSAVRFSIKKELIKRGYQVLPEKAFLIKESDLVEQIRADLKNSILSIHLFGSAFSSIHPQTNLSMEILQNSVAADFYKEQSTLFINGENTTYDFRRIIWFPENAKIKNEKYLKFIDSIKHDLKLYAGADLIRSTPEELKDIIIQKLSGHSSKAEAPPVNDYSERKIEIQTITENTRTTTTTAVPQHTTDQYSRIIQESTFSQ
jgi:hypothetical protein